MKPSRVVCGRGVGREVGEWWVVREGEVCARCLLPYAAWLLYAPLGLAAHLKVSMHLRDRRRQCPPLIPSHLNPLELRKLHNRQLQLMQIVAALYE